jgi:putative phosphoesterase
MFCILTIGWDVASGENNERSIRLLKVAMKIVIISDIHANQAALTALPEGDYDELWCIGDLVDYGPKPHEVIQWIRKKVAIAIRGNHDHAVGFDTDPRCSRAFKHLAKETQRFTQHVCTSADSEFLRSLPIQKEVRIDSTSFYLVHAIPTDPLFGYLPELSERWQKEVEWIRSDVLIVGHTHTPFVTRIGKTTIVNPGSVGQPKTGRPLACYAIWKDGKVLLKEYEYPLIDTIRDIRRMPISRDDQDGLIAVLETGVLPPWHYKETVISGF